METAFKGVITDLKAPSLSEVETNEPLAAGDVIVKVHSCPINPSDMYMTQGAYGVRTKFRSQEKMGCGFEGAGEITEVGEGIDAANIGKKVSFSFDPHAPDFTGTWRQYVKVPFGSVLQYPDSADYDKICSAFVNPLTACGFVDLSIKAGHKAIIQDAACSSLGKMLIKFAKKNDIETINIVRRQEQIDILTGLGATYVLNSETETFYDDLKVLIEKLNPTGYFSAIGGGELPGLVLHKMPHGSTTYAYGALSGDYFKYHPGHFIFSQHTVTGFWLGPWLGTLSSDEKKKWFGAVVTDLSTGGETFGSNVVKTYPIAEFATAIEESVKVASEGKIIIKPQE